MPAKSRLSIILLAGLMAVPVFAFDDSSWSGLGRLKPEDRIGIIQADQKRIEGQFAGFSDSGVSIRAGQVTTVPKENVIRVYRRPRVRRGLRIAIGAGIGLAAGAVLSATVGQYLRNEAHDNPAGVWIACGAAAGAGLGALSGGGYQTVYQRSHP
jgi:hypothetical protein